MKNSTFCAIFVIEVLIAALGWPFAARAETDPRREEALLQEIQNLRALKENNPAVYQETIRQKREQFRQKFQGLQAQDQAGAQSFLKKEGEWRRQRLQYFKEKHPEVFQHFMQQRMGRLDQIAQKNPERFHQFMQNHPQFRTRYESYHREGKSFGPVLEKRPGLKERYVSKRPLAREPGQKFERTGGQHPWQNWRKQKVGAAREDRRRMRA